MTVGASYFGNRIVRHVASDMRELAGRGFTGVLHTFSENDLYHYAETMRRIVDVSHEAGLEVQIGPWAVAGLFGGEAESAFTGLHPELCQALQDGRSAPAACPNQPAVRAFMHRWIDAAAETGADRVFIDEPHWVEPEEVGASAEDWGCRCDLCGRLFRDRFGGEMPGEATDDVLTFRAERLVDFIADLVSYAAGRGVRTTVCLLPITEGVQGLADWSPVAALSGLDTLATDPYWKAFGRPAEPFVREYAGRLRALGDDFGVRTQLWIQGFQVDPEDEPDIRTAVSLGRERGIDELWTWGFDACGHMSRLAGRDPARMWDVLCDALVGRRDGEDDASQSDGARP